jgi:carbon storage regulator CsrA
MSQWSKKATVRGLVITRGEGEKIIINHGELVLEVVQIKGRQVRIAFAASKDISIQRAEAVAQELGHETHPAK